MNFETNMLSYEGKQLDETLQKFFTEIRKKFKSYVGVIEPTPERKDAAFSIAKDIEFSNSRKVLE